VPRLKTKPEAFTIGQLAQKWAIGKGRVQSLVLEGHIPGAFKIPSSGRFGETVKIPLASVLLVEQEWAITPEEGRRTKPPQRRQRNGHSPKLKHFPELQAEPGDDAECPGVDQH
jgi:hypothetical protein